LRGDRDEEWEQEGIERFGDHRKDVKDVVRGGFKCFKTTLTEVKGRTLSALESVSMDDVTVAMKTTISKVRIRTKSLSGSVPFVCTLRMVSSKSRDQNRKETHGTGRKLQVLVED